ncbi:MAG: aminotransferase class III-fold pyridoxal phosphate-dependent enzyme [Parachlamydia sp.]|nr:aminotransferase class III-fold pyridoxal phosphate-dependent enzyme [Parachlamydia sp.]
MNGLPSPNPLLAAGRLAADPRIAEARRLLCEAVADHQKSLTGIRPPIPELRQSYDQMLASLAEKRGSPLWFPYLGSGLGNGVLVELLDGSVKYDFISGIGTHYFGHSHAALIEAGFDAALSDVVMQGNLEQNGDTVALTELLVEISGFDHLFLTTSGAMANENALKIAFQKASPAYRILAFERCFIGRTLAMCEINDKPAYREGLPPNLHVDYIPYYDPKRPQESTQEAIAALEKLMMRYPKQHAAMIFELVQGEGGSYEGSREFFTALMTILKAHGILIIDDEVQSFGRLPSLFAFQHFGLTDFIDIVTIGKLAQVCGTFYRKDLRPRQGLLSQTFTASTSAIRASLAILQRLHKGKFFGPEGRIAKIHERFVKHFEAIAARHPQLVSGPYGMGCMIAFTPFDGHAQKVIRFIHALFEAGVIAFVAGSHPTRVRFLVPAGAVTDEDIDQVAVIIEQTLLRS